MNTYKVYSNNGFSLENLTAENGADAVRKLLYSMGNTGVVQQAEKNTAMFKTVTPNGAVRYWVATDIRTINVYYAILKTKKDNTMSYQITGDAAEARTIFTEAAGQTKRGILQTVALYEIPMECFSEPNRFLFLSGSALTTANKTCQAAISIFTPVGKVIANTNTANTLNTPAKSMTTAKNMTTAKSPEQTGYVVLLQCNDRQGNIDNIKYELVEDRKTADVRYNYYIGMEEARFEDKDLANNREAANRTTIYLRAFKPEITAKQKAVLRQGEKETHYAGESFGPWTTEKVFNCLNKSTTPVINQHPRLPGDL